MYLFVSKGQAVSPGHVMTNDKLKIKKKCCQFEDNIYVCFLLRTCTYRIWRV